MADRVGDDGHDFQSHSTSDRRARRIADEPLWLFVHIPKTAGSSFRTALAEQLKPEHNINIAGLRSTQKRSLAFKAAIDEFLALDAQVPFVFASGHIKMDEAQFIRQALNRPVKFLTMLRDPVQRVISDYRYQCTPAHPTHEAFRATFPTLESYVESRRSQNKMFRYLSLPGERVRAAIKRLEQEFTFIGVAEDYSGSMRFCSELIGPKFPTTTSLNITQPNGHNAIAVSEELVARISHLNRLDQRLWAHFSRRLQQ